jgi:hypothetical protein
MDTSPFMLFTLFRRSMPRCASITACLCLLSIPLNSVATFILGRPIPAVMTLDRRSL